MYGYHNPQAYTQSSIIGRYRQEDIFALGMNGELPELGKYYLSPFRKDDTSPGCFFEWYKDKLVFVDFADPVINRDCFYFIKDIFNLQDIPSTLDLIMECFLQNKTPEMTNPVLREYQEKKRSQIFFRTRQFEERDRLFWSPYEITFSQLRSDNVFAASMIKMYLPKKDKWSIYRPSHISYIIGGFGERCKVYNPTRKKDKWFTNCTKDDVGGLKSVNYKSNHLIITKSYKDWRVVVNQGYNSVWFQNEGMFPSSEILNNLLTIPKVIIFFDNDETGFKASNSLKELLLSFNTNSLITQLFSPFFYLKDASDILSVKGRGELQQLLWKECHL